MGLENLVNDGLEKYEAGRKHARDFLLNAVISEFQEEVIKAGGQLNIVDDDKRKGWQKIEMVEVPDALKSRIIEYFNASNI